MVSAPPVRTRWDQCRRPTLSRPDSGRETGADGHAGVVSINVEPARFVPLPAFAMERAGGLILGLMGEERPDRCPMPDRMGYE